MTVHRRGALHAAARLPLATVLALAVSVGALVACTKQTQRHAPMDDMPGMAAVPAAPSTPPVSPADPTGTGLSATTGGYTFVPAADTVPAGVPSTFSFRITGRDGHTVTGYQPYESRLVQLFLVRSDLTGFRNLDAAMRQDGTWSAALPALPAGSYRAFVTFASPDAGHGTPLVYTLSRPFTVPGAATTIEVPAPARSSTVDGYVFALSGDPATGRTVPVALTAAKDGKPVESFNRYLDGYAHLTAFHAGDLATARVLATGGIGANGAVTSQVTFPESGTWRVYAQVDLAGTVHTAAFTVTVPAG